MDYRLRNAKITRRFHEMAKSQPIIYPSYAEWEEIRLLVENEIPSFKGMVNSDELYPLSDMEYDVCIAVRVHLSPIEISKLKKCAPSTISKIRKKLLSVIFHKDGNSDDFDDEIRKIR